MCVCGVLWPRLQSPGIGPLLLKSTVQLFCYILGVLNASQTTDNHHHSNSRLDSPTKTFNRSSMAEKTVWPLGHNGPSTYL